MHKLAADTHAALFSADAVRAMRADTAMWLPHNLRRGLTSRSIVHLDAVGETTAVDRHAASAQHVA